MAKVNEGVLNFASAADASMTIPDVLTILYQQINTSRELVQKKIGDITYKTNPLRYEHIPASIETGDLDASADWQMKMLSGVNSKSDLAKIMQFISKLDRKVMKKAMVINLMRYGLHIYLADDFHLVEDIRQTYDPALMQIIEDYINQVNEGNVEINRMIEEFKKYSEADIKDAETLLFDVIERTMGADGIKLANDYGYYLKTGGMTNIKNAFDHLIKDEEASKEFTSALTIYRSVISQYDSPSIGQLQSHFNISPSSYKTNRADGLNLLIKTLPKTFLSRVI